MAIDCGLDGRGAGVHVPAWWRSLSFPRRPDRSRGSASYLMGIGGCFLGIKAAAA
jgi:hypothetical protein